MKQARDHLFKVGATPANLGFSDESPIRKLNFNEVGTEKVDSACAMGFAVLAANKGAANMRHTLAWLGDVNFTCPECNIGDRGIAHLNDHHAWSVEQIATFLESLS